MSPTGKDLSDEQYAAIAWADPSESSVALSERVGLSVHTVRKARQRFARAGGWWCELVVRTCPDCGQPFLAEANHRGASRQRHPACQRQSRNRQLRDLKRRKAIQRQQSRGSVAHLHVSWTPAEDARLRETLTVLAKDVAEELGRTAKSIYHRRSLLRTQSAVTMVTAEQRTRPETERSLGRQHRPWTPAEDARVRQTLALPAQDVAEELGRSRAAISLRRLHVRRTDPAQTDGHDPRTGALWTPEEDARLLETPAASAWDLAEELGRSPGSIAFRRHLLRHASTARRDAAERPVRRRLNPDASRRYVVWTPEEDAQLLETPARTAEDLAEELGRSVPSISARRYQLRGQATVAVDNVDHRTLPHPDSSVDRQRLPWTPEEDARVLDTLQMPVQDVAVELGRSRNAISTRRKYVRRTVPLTDPDSGRPYVPWTPEEEARVLQTLALPAQDVAEELGRSRDAIYKRRKHLLRLPALRRTST